MEKEKLKQILLKYYKEVSVYPILRGEKRPSYGIIYKLHFKHGVPFDVWADIKSFIKNDTKKEEVTSSAEI